MSGAVMQDRDKPDPWHDGTMPRFLGAQTSGAIAWTVTVQISAVLAALVLPFVLIRTSWMSPAEAGLVLGLVAATRRSHCVYRRIRLQ